MWCANFLCFFGFVDKPKGGGGEILSILHGRIMIRKVERIPSSTIEDCPLNGFSSSNVGIVASVPVYSTMAIRCLVVIIVLTVVSLQVVEHVGRWSLHVTDEKKQPNGHLARDGDDDLHFCVWNDTLAECETMLAPALRQKPIWIFFGDSTMAMLFAQVEYLWPYECMEFKISKRCYRQQYYGLSKPDKGTWKPPNISLGEGPVGFGLSNPFCSECSICKNVLIGSSTYGGEERALEFLGVEFARDVIDQTNITQTTQETVHLYLQQKNIEDPRNVVCIVNTGLHDYVVGGTIPTDTYVKNVDDYLSLLLPTCGNLVWLSTSATLEMHAYSQRNAKILEMNDAVANLLRVSYPNAFFLDVYPKSNKTKHFDNVHLDENDYYVPLGEMFVRFIKP